MEQGPRPSPYSLRDSPAAFRWGVLASASLAVVGLAEWLKLPAAPFLGSMIAAIVVTVTEGGVTLPPWTFLCAQGFIGCLVGRSIDPNILSTILAHWPIFVVCVFAVVIFANGLGAALAYWKVLPGTTAIWGSSPGASTVMVLMAEAFGGDIRLVAFMQFLRMGMVAAVASVVVRIWVGTSGAAFPAIDWFPAIPLGSFVATAAIAVGAAFLGRETKLPAAPVILPMIVSSVLSATHVVAITLPPWLMLAPYMIFGWFVGLRFTRDVVIYAARMSPRIVASILTLIGVCGALGYVLHIVTGTDALTAYLATSPGGMDSVAIIAASSNVDMPFIMAMQVARFLLVLSIGPALARMAARWLEQGTQPS